ARSNCRTARWRQQYPQRMTGPTSDDITFLMARRTSLRRTSRAQSIETAPVRSFADFPNPRPLTVHMTVRPGARLETRWRSLASAAFALRESRRGDAHEDRRGVSRRA